MKHFRFSTLAFVLCLISDAGIQADDWPQWMGPKRDGRWREQGIVEQLPEKLHVVWKAPLDEGYAGPAVANGRVFITDRVLKPGESNPDNPFDRRNVIGMERIYCLDEATGEEIWKHEYPSTYTISYSQGTRATPTVDGDRVYCLGAMGDLFCMKTNDGKIIWSKNYVKEFGTQMNAWGMTAAPLVYKDFLICVVGGQKESCIVAFNKQTGEKVWNALYAKDPGYAAPIIIDQAGQKRLVVWTTSHLSLLNPDNGELYYQYPMKSRSGVSIATPVYNSEQKQLFITAFYNGPRMFSINDNPQNVDLLWKGNSDSERDTDGLHACICTPYIQNDHIYGVCSYGQLRCLNAKTGERLWETFEATGNGRWWNAFLIPHEDRTFICNEQGELILAKLTPNGYNELGRTQLIEPTNRAGRRIKVWSHPAFANKRIYARNDKEIICVEMSQQAYE